MVILLRGMGFVGEMSIVRCRGLGVIKGFFKFFYSENIERFLDGVLGFFFVKINKFYFCERNFRILF